MKVLIIEDHPSIRKWIITLLKKKNITAEGAINGQEWLEKLAGNNFDVIIVDVNMPIMGWREFISTIRKQEIHTPVLALTSNSMIDDKIHMFELGVDDYVTKPFDFWELYVRLLALAKRQENIQNTLYTFWEISIDCTANKVLLWSEEIEFQNKQHKIIQYLSANQGIPKTKLNIMQYAWWEQSDNLQFNTTALESHMYIIRKKLGKDFIKTLKGVWYFIG